MFKSSFLSFITALLYSSVLLCVPAYSPTDAARLQNNLNRQISNSQDRALQGALNGIGVVVDRMHQHMKILQILTNDSCLVKKATETSVEIIHVKGINGLNLVDNNYLPQNNIFFYGSLLHKDQNLDQFLNKLEMNRILLIENGTYNYVTGDNIRKTIKSYKYIPFLPKQNKNGEFTYQNQSISQEEFELLWKIFGFYIYKFNAVDSKSLPHLSKFKMHFIYCPDRMSKNETQWFIQCMKNHHYVHINKYDFLYYLNNGGKIFEANIGNSFVICSKCNGTGIYKGQQCIRCLGNKKTSKKTTTYNLVTIDSLRNFTNKYLNKNASKEKDSQQRDKSNKILFLKDQDNDKSEENDKDDVNIIEENEPDKD